MIYIKDYRIQNPKASVIITHGIAEHSGRYEELALRLSSEGFDVITYDLLGHGQSSGKRGAIKSFHEHIDNLHKIVLDEKNRYPKKIFLIGHSMGGGIVNIYAVKYGDIDGIVSIGAATHTPENAEILRKIGFWYLRWYKIDASIFDNYLAKDPEVLAKNKKDPLMLDYMRVSLIGEMFVKGVNYLHKNIENFKTPILYLHGRLDKIVDVSFSQKMYDKIDVEDKELKIYKEGYHEILNDYEKEEVMNDICNWLNQRS